MTEQRNSFLSNSYIPYHLHILSLICFLGTSDHVSVVRVANILSLKQVKDTVPASPDTTDRQEAFPIHKQE